MRGLRLVLKGIAALITPTVLGVAALLGLLWREHNCLRETDDGRILGLSDQVW
jgi:hypothetical protein